MRPDLEGSSSYAIPHCSLSEALSTSNGQRWLTEVPYTAFPAAKVPASSSVVITSLAPLYSGVASLITVEGWQR